MSLRKIICRLCLTVSGNEFEEIDEITRELLDVLNLKLNLDITKNPIVCQDCLKIVKKAFDFKSVCVETEELISSLLIDKNKGEIDLKDIYRDYENVDGDFDICRLCINQIEINNFVPLSFLIKDKMFMDMILVYMPEMDINIIKNPVICTTCNDSLECYFKFAQNCIFIEDKINTFCRDKGTSSKGKVNLSKILHIDSSNVVKIEEMSIKEEQIDMDLMLKNVDPYPVEIYDINNLKVELPDSRNLSTYYRVCTCTTNNAHCVKCTSIKEEPSEMIMYRCKTCTYVTNEKGKLNKHILVHEKVPAYMHKCTICTYKTKYVAALKKHTLSHMDVSESEMYMCPVCPVKTKYKSSMQRHVLVHKDPSEVNMHRCVLCDYETEEKVELKNHMLSHKNISGDLYKCAMCTFDTKYKANILRHMLQHKDTSEIEIYKCNLCSYEGKYKHNLAKHMLTHKEAIELEMYQCANCSFKTSRKSYLKKHFLIHRTPTELDMYKCPMCVFETSREVYLKKHMMRHEEPVEEKMHKCTKCTYKTHRKDSLYCHMKIHNRPPKVEELFKCTMCSYDTNRKCYLEKHMLIHKGGST